MAIEFTRNCPTCNKLLYYTLQSNLYRASKNNTKCIDCTRIKNTIPKDLTRNCPECNTLLSYKNYDSITRANKNNSLCRSCGLTEKRGINHNLIRTCPDCNKEIKYKSKNGFKRAIEISAKCLSCTKKFKENKITEIRTRVCPQCNNIINYSSYHGVHTGNKRNTVCIKCSKLSCTKDKVNLFRNCPQCNKIMAYTRWGGLTRANKNNAICVECSHKNPRESTRQKQRIKKLKELENMHGQLYPGYNPDACVIFDKINEHFQWNGQHAENGNEYNIKELGYWVDYYVPELNLVIEYDEKHHKYPRQKKKDAQRQHEITKYLNCKFIRIKETDSYDDIIQMLTESLFINKAT